MASHHQLLQSIQFENWSTREVAQWLQGLDESAAQYGPVLQECGVDGRKLLMMNHGDLEKIGIRKLGHQELVLEAVDLLRSLRYTLETENLQSMALQLGCKARNIVTELQTKQGENDQNWANLMMRRGEAFHQGEVMMPGKRLTITVLSYVADMLTTLKNLVSWLDRPPFEGIYDICRLRNSIVKLGIEMVMVTQRENSFSDPKETISDSCRTLMECCDGLVQNTKDPLVIQPAALEQATIRKKQGEELGMNIQSAFNGIHKISSIKELSPADMCSKIEKGDELLQVNGRTVLGWQLKELVRILKDNPKEVSLLLKKRPRHINPLGAMQHHRRRLAANHAQHASTLPKSLKKRRSREAPEPPKQSRPCLQELVSSAGAATSSTAAATADTGGGVGSIYVTKDKAATEAGEGDGNDTDNEVFRSGSESPQYMLPVMPDPKQRRATVSGGSPTFEHNSLMVEDPVAVSRPMSQFISKVERDLALALKANTEAGLLQSVSSQAGEDAGLETKGSESSTSQKLLSESELDDSVFSSDKEDQQTPKPAATAEVKRQGFRVAKPKPVLMDHAPSASRPSHPPPPPPPKSPLAKTVSSSTSSSTASTSTVVNSPLLGSNPEPAVIGSSAVGLPSFSVQSPTAKWRPPSPVSAPPSRKKSLTTELDDDNVKQRRGRMGSERSEMAPSPLAADPSKTVQVPSGGMVVPSSTVPTGMAVSSSGVPSVGPASKQEAEQVWRHTSLNSLPDSSSSRTESLTTPRESTFRAESLPSTRESTSSPRAWEEGGGSARTSDVVVRRGVGEKGKPLVLESAAGSAGVHQDRRPVSVQQAIFTEVATDPTHKDTPQLMKIKKLESPTTADAPDLKSESPETPKQKKRVDFTPETKEASPPQEVSYTHIIVGGVVQKIPVENAITNSPPVKLRQKSGSRRLDRRVSCKDLGKGDCEGWLYKRKEKDHRLSKHWHKHWCVLKNFNLYYYKHKEDLKAKGVIYLPAFQVSPATDLKTKKFPFKVHNTGTTFYFASERQDDMSKWMNKMGLAAISFDTSKVVTTGGFIKPEPRSNHLGMANVYYSESEEEVDEGSQYGSVLSLNSLSSLGSATAPQPSPPVFKRAVTSVSSDPTALEPKLKPPGAKGDRAASSRN